MKIRPARIEDVHEIAHIHVDTWRTTYRGIMSDSLLDGLNYDMREEYWRTQMATRDRDGTFALVAEDDTPRVAGFAVGGPNREKSIAYSGELYAIYLLQEIQRRGVGRLLVKETACQLLERSHANMVVWVLKENLFCKFYEALGGQYLKEQEFQLAGEKLVEVGYGWPDLHPLCEMQ